MSTDGVALNNEARANTSGIIIFGLLSRKYDQRIFRIGSIYSWINTELCFFFPAMAGFLWYPSTPIEANSCIIFL